MILQVICMAKFVLQNVAFATRAAICEFHCELTPLSFFVFYWQAPSESIV